MKHISRYVICFISILLAVFLQRIYLEYRVQPVIMSRMSADTVMPTHDEIIMLGLVDLDPPKGSELAKYHGRIGAQRGLFARGNRSVAVAVLFGIVSPLLLVLFALYLTFARRTFTIREVKIAK